MISEHYDLCLRINQKYVKEIYLKQEPQRNQIPEKNDSFIKNEFFIKIESIYSKLIFKKKMIKILMIFIFTLLNYHFFLDIYTKKRVWRIINTETLDQLNEYQIFFSNLTFTYEFSLFYYYFVENEEIKTKILTREFFYEDSDGSLLEALKTLYGNFQVISLNFIDAQTTESKKINLLDRLLNNYHEFFIRD